MKVLFAFNNEGNVNSLVDFYKKTYGEKLEVTKVYFFRSLVDTLRKNKNFDRVVIHEELEPFGSKNQDAIDKYLFNNLDKATDEAGKADIILICTERRQYNDKFVKTLFNLGIYNFLCGQDRTFGKVSELIKKPRTKKEAKTIVDVDLEENPYEASEKIDELELRNIIKYYEQNANNKQKILSGFNSLYEQYTFDKLKQIVPFLPIKVREVLEQNSELYIGIMSYKPPKAGKGEKVKIVEVPVYLPQEEMKNPNPPPVYEAPKIETKIQKPKIEKNIQPLSEGPIIEEKETVLDNVIQTVAAPIAKTMEKLEEKDEKPKIKYEPKVIEKEVELPTEKPRIEPDYKVKYVDNEVEEIKPKVEKVERHIEKFNSEIKHKEVNKPEEKVETKIPERKINKFSDMFSKKVEPKVVTPVVEPPKVEPKVVTPVVEPPKVEPKVVTPVVEPPKVEPKVVTPVVEPPKVKPKVVTPVVEPPKVEPEVVTPVVEPPKVEPEVVTPVVEPPKVEPEVVTPVVEPPKVEPKVPVAEEAKPVMPKYTQPVQQVQYTQPNRYQPPRPMAEEPKIQTVTQVIEKEVIKEVYDTPHDYKKAVCFIGAHKTGTTFIINAVANILTSKGVNVAILDLTNSKDSYLIYTNRDLDQKDVAANSLNNLAIGQNRPFKLGNLSIYTGTPRINNKKLDVYKAIEIAKRENSVVLIDCDFTTKKEMSDVFRYVQSIYVVQDMDVLNILPITMFLKELKNVDVDTEKISVIVNKYMKASIKLDDIVGQLSYYTSPDFSVMEEGLLPKNVKKFIVPFDEQNYLRYLENITSGKMNFSGFSESFKQAISIIIQDIFPIGSRPMPRQVEDTGFMRGIFRRR